MKKRIIISFLALILSIVCYSQDRQNKQIVFGKDTLGYLPRQNQINILATYEQNDARKLIIDTLQEKIKNQNKQLSNDSLINNQYDTIVIHHKNIENEFKSQIGIKDQTIKSDNRKIFWLTRGLELTGIIIVGESLKIVFFK